MNFQDLSIDRSWTLFLDRDGVINERIVGGYATRWEEFRLIEGATGAIAGLSRIFGRIIVVTNQQGVGKGLMASHQVDEIHSRMISYLTSEGAPVDAVYFSPHLESEQHPDRKPGIGMALRAQREFPGIRLDRSVMVGDSLSDMQFGRNSGMVNVLIRSADNEEPVPESLYDFCFASLAEFANSIINTKSTG